MDQDDISVLRGGLDCSLYDAASRHALMLIFAGPMPVKWERCRAPGLIIPAKQLIGGNHPNITVTLVGHDGNAFGILGRCKQAMRSAGLPPAGVEHSAMPTPGFTPRSGVR
jgi:hypothetical protein